MADKIKAVDFNFYKAVLLGEGAWATYRVSIYLL
jgi:hypothetical protein